MGKMMVVVYDIEFSSKDPDADLEWACMAVFGMCPDIQLKSGSATHYRFSDWDEVAGHPGMYVAALDQSSKAAGLEHITDEAGRTRSVNKEVGTNIAVDHAMLLIVPSRNALIVQYRSKLPETTVQSVVRNAARYHASRGSDFSLKVTPREQEMSIDEMFDLFASLTKVAIRFRHSQSPGDRTVDADLEAMNAEWVSQSIRSSKKGRLNKDAVRDPRHSPVAKPIAHVDLNDKNGVLTLEGRDDAKQPLVVRSDKSIQRKKIETTDTVESFAETIVAQLDRWRV